MKIGLIGLGRMGSAIAGRLQDEGFAVVAWDRDAGRVPQAGRGIIPAEGPREVAVAADVVLSIITEDSGVQALWQGAGGFLEADIAGKMFVEMSTLRPDTVRGVAELAHGRGAGFVDSPVLGSIPTVREGKLVSLIGGSEADVARATEVLRHLTSRIEHMGPVGAGCAMKLVVNNMMGSYLQILAESLMLGESQGLGLERMVGMLGASINATPWFHAKKGILLGGEDDITLDIRTLRKDILSVVATAASGGVPTPAAAATAAGMSAAVSEGLGARDIAELVGYWRRVLPQRW
jgi:3-hydroxyisobutyrate dehydrogenase